MLSRKVLAVLLSAFMSQTAVVPPAISAEQAAAKTVPVEIAASPAVAEDQLTAQTSATRSAQPSATRSAQTPEPTKQQRAALDLARKVLDAMGGLDKIKKFNATAYRVTGDYEQISSMSGSSNVLDFELTSRGYQQKSKVNFMGRPVITCYDGKTCWTSHGEDVLPTDVVTARRVREDLDHGYLLLEKLLDKDRKMSIVPSTRSVDGQECIALSVIADDGKATVFYIAPKTHLVTRSEYQGIDMEQGTECLKAYEYSNYRLLDGTMQPFKTVEYSGDKRVGVLTVKEYTTKIELADNFFAMPGAQSIARLKQGAVVVPFWYTANEILVKVSLDGQPEKVFLVDTGATQSIVDSNAATGLKTTSGDDFSITTGSGSMKMSYADIKSFKLGEIILSHVPVAVTSMARFANVLQYKPAGLIGANVLKRFAITIDYDKQQLILQDPDKFVAPPNAVAVDSKPSLGTSGLALDGTLDDKLNLTFLIDSGAAFNHVSESLIKEKFSDPILPVGTIKGLDGTPVNTGAVRFKTLRFGTLTVNNPIFSVAPSPPPNDTTKGGIISGGAIAIIGNPLLARYRVTIDYRNQKVYFEQSQERKTEDELMARLDGAIYEFYKTGDKNLAASALNALAAEAEARSQPAVKMLATAYEALIASNNGDIPALVNSKPEAGATKSEPTDAALRSKLEAADNLATVASKDVRAKVLLLRALAEAGNTDFQSRIEAGKLVGQALMLNQNEPMVYSMMALLGLKSQQFQKASAGKAPNNGTTGATNDSSSKETATSPPATGSASTPATSSASTAATGSATDDTILSTIHPTLKPSAAPTQSSALSANSAASAASAPPSGTRSSKNGMTILLPEQIVKQALMLDPADWLGLWVRRSIALENGKQDEARLIERQLRRYYPDARDVKALPN